MPPPKPPGKRIQTQEIRQRKPVISKKFFGKIFAQSPEAARTLSEAGGGTAGNIYGPQSAIFSETLKNSTMPSQPKLSIPIGSHDLQPVN